MILRHTPRYSYSFLGLFSNGLVSVPLHVSPVSSVRVFIIFQIYILVLNHFFSIEHISVPSSASTWSVTVSCQSQNMPLRHCHSATNVMVNVLQSVFCSTSSVDIHGHNFGRRTVPVPFWKLEIVSPSHAEIFFDSKTANWLLWNASSSQESARRREYVIKYTCSNPLDMQTSWAIHACAWRQSFCVSR